MPPQARVGALLLPHVQRPRRPARRLTRTTAAAAVGTVRAAPVATASCATGPCAARHCRWTTPRWSPLAGFLRGAAFGAKRPTSSVELEPRPHLRPGRHAQATGLRLDVHGLRVRPRRRPASAAVKKSRSFIRTTLRTRPNKGQHVHRRGTSRASATREPAQRLFAFLEGFGWPAAVRAERDRLWIEIPSLQGAERASKVGLPAHRLVLVRL
jgi:hypothetical protein